MSEAWGDQELGLGVWGTMRGDLCLTLSLGAIRCHQEMWTQWDQLL